VRKLRIRKLLLTAMLLAIMTFSATLALLWAVSQATTGVPNETRRQALITTLANMQQAEKPQEQTYQTMMILEMLKCLNSLDRINETEAIDYLVSQQNTTTGGFSDDFHIYGELNTPFDVLNTLKTFNSSHMLDESLIDFVMLRHNETDGAFHEPTFERNGEKIASCGFSMTWHGWGDRDYYGESNVISTFLAVDILRNLNALDRINVTRTIAFVLGCRTANGGFGPFPNPYTSTYGSSLIPWLANSFTVDSYGAGVAYTYCAVGALNDLGCLSSLTDEERQQTIDYVLSCQHNRTGCFVSIPEYAADPGSSPEDHDTFFTYYAVMALQYLNAINQTRENVIKAMRWFLTIQNPDSGLVYELSPIAGAYYFVMCMNASDSLYLLNELTPRALQQRTLFLGISSALGFTTFTIIVAVPYTVKWAQNRKQKQETPESQSLETI
jgi:prenyltransferase beta subunit